MPWGAVRRRRQGPVCSVNGPPLVSPRVTVPSHRQSRTDLSGAARKSEHTQAIKLRRASTEPAASQLAKSGIINLSIQDMTDGRNSFCPQTRPC